MRRIRINEIGRIKMHNLIKTAFLAICLLTTSMFATPSIAHDYSLDTVETAGAIGGWTLAGISSTQTGALAGLATAAGAVAGGFLVVALNANGVPFPLCGVNGWKCYAEYPQE